MRCRCGSGRRMGYDDCPIHVECDQDCKALLDPRSVAEVRAALEHWRDHSWVSGCSHGR